MKIGDSFQLNAENFSTSFECLQEGLISFERTHNWSKVSLNMDVVTSSWSFAFANLKPDQLAILRHGKTICNSGPWMLLIPPFSMVNFRINKGLFRWKGYISNESLDDSLPKEPVAMPWNGGIPKCVGDIETMIDASSERILVGAEEEVSAVATKARAEIDASFSSEAKISDIVKRLNFNHGTMTRAFKKAYGISPVEYRNKLRTWEALSQILFNQKSMITTSMDVGFNSIERFNINFRKNTGTIPSGFLSKKFRVKEQ